MYCLNCNKKIIKGKYCNQTCYREYRSKFKFKCSICGKEFKTFKGVEKHELNCKGKCICGNPIGRNSKFCSKTCEQNFMNENKEYCKALTKNANEKNRELGKNGLLWIQQKDEKAQAHIKKWYTAGINATKEKVKNNKLWSQIDKEKVKNAMLKIHTKEANKKISEKLKGRKLSEQHKNNISKTRIEKKIAKGKNNPMYGKHPITTKGFKSGKRLDLDNEFFRSTWEANFARILRYENKLYFYEKYTFPIKINNNDNTYTPDFKVDNIFYEIKGFWYDDAKLKFESFKEQYPDIEIKVIDKIEYIKLKNKYKNLIINWEE